MSGAILHRQQRPREAPSEFAHAGVCGRGGDVNTATIIEQRLPEMREIRIAEAYSGQRIKVYRLRRLTWPDRQAIVAGLRERVAKREKYGSLRILAFLVDSVIADLISLVVKRPVEIRLFTRIRILGRWVCSEVVAQALAPYGVQFVNGSRLEGMINGAIGWILTPIALASRIVRRLLFWWRRRRTAKALAQGWGVTPDDIADYAAGHPEEWLLVFDDVVTPAGSANHPGTEGLCESR